MTDFEPLTRTMTDNGLLARNGDRLMITRSLTEFFPVLEEFCLTLKGHPLTLHTFHTGDVIQFNVSKLGPQAYRRIGENMWSGSGVITPPTDSGAYDYLRRRAVLIRDNSAYWPWGTETLRLCEEREERVNRHTTVPHNGAANQPVIEDCVRELLGRAILSKSTQDELQALVGPSYKDGTVARLRLHDGVAPVERLGQYDAETQKWWTGRGRRGVALTWRGPEIEVLEIIKDGEDK